MKYDLSLVEWITLGLNKDYMNQALTYIREGKPLEEMLHSRQANKHYIEKVLREEVFKQFSDNRRPVVEVLLNAIDAKPTSHKGDYKIDVKVENGYFSSMDSGTGMGLEDVLRVLIIPFSTEKIGLEEIGKFGVGFLSTFNYCLNRPEHNGVMLETGNGKERCRLKFYATSNQAESIRMVLKPSKSKKKGTVVSASGINHSKKYIISFIDENLANIPSYKAMIYVNGKPINASTKNPWYDVDVDMNINGKTISQKLGFKHNKGIIDMLSQGVTVTNLRINSDMSHQGAIISFPSAVKLVEGRDEFKKDDNYNKCILSTFTNVEKYIDDNIDDMKVTSIEKMNTADIGNYITVLASSLGVNSLKQIPNIAGMQKKYFDNKEFVMSEYELSHYRKFFGKESVERCMGLSAPSVVYWEELLKSSKDFLENQILEEEIMSRKSFQSYVVSSKQIQLVPVSRLFDTRNRPNIGSIFNNKFQKIHLVKLKSDGETPITVYDENLYLNMGHECLRSNTLHNAYLVGVELFKNLVIWNSLSAHLREPAFASVLRNMNHWPKNEKAIK